MPAMDSESALLAAVRDKVRTTLSYENHQCDIEFDELPPAGAGDFYVAIMPGGWRPGPRNDHNGGVLDEIIDVDVAVIQRAPKVPRDRSRKLFLDILTGLNKRHRQILAAFGHFAYDVLVAANVYLETVDDYSEGFVEPLKFAGLEAKPRMVGAEYFKAQPGEEFAGLVRRAHFAGARRLQHISGGIT